MFEKSKDQFNKIMDMALVEEDGEEKSDAGTPTKVKRSESSASAKSKSSPSKSSPNKTSPGGGGDVELMQREKEDGGAGGARKRRNLD